MSESFNEFTPRPSSQDRPDPGYRRADDKVTPVVTIVTPYYNTGDVFRETAASVLRQTLQQ